MYCLNIRVCKQLWFRSCCSAHAAGMINTRYINYDSFLLANSHKNKSSWWRGVYQLSARFDQWERVEGTRGGVHGDWRASWPMCALRFGKKERRLCDNKSLRLHLNARDFSQHKSKMSAGRIGGCVAPGRRVFGAKNCPFFSPPGSRPTLTTSLKDNKVSLTKKKYVRRVKYKKNVLANYLHSVWWIIECN